jgi:class 3 adenylate cyclase
MRCSCGGVGATRCWKVLESEPRRDLPRLFDGRVREYVEHYHGARNHQRVGNRLIGRWIKKSRFDRVPRDAR